jgi:hypothetical protein
MLEKLIASIEQIMDEHDQKYLANVIVDFISKYLVTCPRPQSKKLVLGCVLSHSKVLHDLPNHVLLVKLVVAQ